jgi:hypothetical protein
LFAAESSYSPQEFDERLLRVISAMWFRLHIIELLDLIAARGVGNGARISWSGSLGAQATDCDTKRQANPGAKRNAS